MSLRVHPRIRAYYEAQAEACGAGSASAMAAMVLEGVMHATAGPERVGEPTDTVMSADALRNAALAMTLLRDPAQPLGAALGERGVNAVSIDRPGGMWVMSNHTWVWREWLDLDANRLAELVEAAAAAVQMRSAVIGRGSLGPSIRMEVLRPPVAPHQSGALAFRVSAVEPVSLESLASLFEGAGGASRYKPRGDRPLVPVHEDIAGRLRSAIAGRENIVLSAPPLWERIELVERLLRSIPADRRVVIIEEKGQKNPTVRSDARPPNSVVLTYERGRDGVAFAELALAAAAFWPDPIVVPNARAVQRVEFQLGIGNVFGGQVVATDAHESDEAFISAADVVVRVVLDRVAPMGVGEMLARPSCRA